MEALVEYVEIRTRAQETQSTLNKLSIGSQNPIDTMVR